MNPVLGTLKPGAGLARRWVLRPPGPASPLWALLVDLGPRAGGLAGAYGAERESTMVRGVGEAVERFSLLPTASSPDDGPLEARCLASGDPVGMEPSMVDYPAGPGVLAAGVDPSPSGAAAGLSFDQALRAALVETIERDAVQVAWTARLRLPGVDPAGWGGDDGPACGHLDRLLGWVSDHGMRVALGRIPTCVEGLACAVAVLIDEAADLASTGVKVGTDPAPAVLGALQEALQVREFLCGLRARLQGPATPPSAGPVTDDESRARYWSRPGARASLAAWAETFEPSSWPAPAQVSLPAPADLAAALIADGAGPMVVDLTARLPEAVRGLGWHAVKVLAPGYQALRMDERLTSTWRWDRLDSAPRRTGLAKLAPGFTAIPHPLI